MVDSTVNAKDEPRQRFTLWAITKIAYQVKYTSMAYRP
jgi:hypothetical protein